MNTLLISSEDLDSGQIYDGQYDLNRTISGIFSLDYVHFDGPSTYPYIWNGVNKFKWAVTIADYNEAEDSTSFRSANFESELDYAFLSGSPSAAFLQDAILGLMNTAMATTFGYNPHSLDQFTVVLSGSNLTIRLRDYGDDHTIWHMNIYWTESTCRDIFHKTQDESTPETPEDWTDSKFDFAPISGINFAGTPPTFLTVKMDQSSEYLIRSKPNTFHSFAVSTEDIPLTNQSINLVDNTRVLNLSFYHPITNLAPIPFTGDYIFIFNVK